MGKKRKFIAIAIDLLRDKPHFSNNAQTEARLLGFRAA